MKQKSNKTFMILSALGVLFDAKSGGKISNLPCPFCTVMLR